MTTSLEMFKISAKNVNIYNEGFYFIMSAERQEIRSSNFSALESFPISPLESSVIEDLFF